MGEVRDRWLVVAALAVAFACSACGGPPTDEACDTIPPTVLAPVVGVAVHVIEGVTPDPPGNERGCYYSMKRAPGAVEVWVLKQGAANAYSQNAKAEAATPVDHYMDVSGSGFRAYQTDYDSAILKGGVLVTVQLTLPNDLGQVATVSSAAEAILLGRLRSAILAALH